MRRPFLLAAALLCLATGAWAQTAAQKLLLLSGQDRPLLTLNFMNGTLPEGVIFGRLAGGTTALYTDTPGQTVTPFVINAPRFIGGAIPGLLTERSATNFLLNSAAPVTQTTGTLPTGNYTFFCNGTGSVTSSLGTATATGIGALVCNSSTYQTITVSVAGTLTLTVSGWINWFDLQNAAFPIVPTSHIVTTGTTSTRALDNAHIAVSSIGGWSPLAGATLVRFSQNDSASAAGRVVGTNLAVEFGLASNGSFYDQASINLSTVGQTSGFAVSREAASWSPAGITATTNGTSSVSSTSTPNAANLAAVTTIYIGNQQGSNNAMNGVFQKLAFYRSLSLAQQALLTSAGGGF